MRGIISFVFLVLLIESFLMVITLNSLEYENSSDKLLHSLKLLDFYEDKIKVKRELQNLLNSGSKIKNPTERIKYVAKELENYENFKEFNSDYDIDLWCGYLNSESIEFMLNSDNKPLPIQDMNSKIIIEKEEVHYCTTVLVFDTNLQLVKVGRNYVGEHFNLLPAIGFKIKTKDDSLVDVDYIGGTI